MSEPKKIPKCSRIYVAGHKGMVGSAIVRELRRQGFNNLLMATRKELDLRDSGEVNNFFLEHKPEFIFLAAAKVGGILANVDFAADFIRDNLQIQTNVVDAAYRNNAKKLLFLGSSCIYPKLAPQPLKAEYLLTSELESTNEYYAIAKIAGLKLCQAYRHQYGFEAICAMPTNLYGPQDNFDLSTSHVLPALIRKCHLAKIRGEGELEVWGSGSPRREFLHVHDLASACIYLMHYYSKGAPINIGWGADISVKELAELVARLVGFSGNLKFDSSKPDGTPRKLLDVTCLEELGWRPRIELGAGIAQTYEWYLEHYNH